MFQLKYFSNQLIIFRAEFLPASVERNSQDSRAMTLLSTITVAFLTLQPTEPG